MELKQILSNHATRAKLNAYLEARDNKLLSMLAWCSIWLLFGYFIIILNTIKFYGDIQHHRPLYGSIMLVNVLLLFALFFGILWQAFTYKPLVSKTIIRDFMGFNTSITERRHKWLEAYLVVYFIAVAATGLRCWYLMAHGIAMTGVMLPATIVVYGAGLLLTAKLAAERKKFINYLHLMDKKLVK